jgi:hypothetical protein
MAFDMVPFPRSGALLNAEPVVKNISRVLDSIDIVLGEVLCRFRNPTEVAVRVNWGQ